METKIPAILAFLLALFLISIDAWGLTSAQLEANIRAATTGCPDFTVTNPTPGGATLNATNYGVSTNNTGAQNYADFTTAITACKTSGANKLIVPTGTYKVGNYVAGHSGGSYSDGTFYFDHLTNFTFDGQGSTFLMQNHSVFVNVQYCSQVALQNYTMGWDWSQENVESLVEVLDTGFDSTGAYVDVYYPYETSPDPTDNIYEMDEVDTNNYDFSQNSKADGIIGVWQLNTNAAVSEGTSKVRYYATEKGENWFNAIGVVAGQDFIIRHYSYEYKGYNLENNRNLTITNVTVYSTLGMGFFMDSDKYTEIVNSKLIREPGSIYHLSSAADGINNDKGYGYLKLINDEIGNAGDDSINLHDGISQGVTVKSANTLVANGTVDWRDPYSAGDVVELRKNDFTPWNYQSTLTAATNNGSSYTLVFSSNLPAGVSNATDSILFNDSYNSGNYLISGCYIHDNKGKGCFVHVANGTIENNQFIDNYNPGLFMLCVAASYLEGYNPSNILVHNNYFDGNNIERTSLTDGNYPQDIVLLGDNGGIVSDPICQDIIIQSNLVENSTYAGLEVASATNILVENNTFENLNLWNDQPTNIVAGCIMVLKSSSVIFSNNNLVVDAGVTSYKTNIYLDTTTATNNIFVFPFASVTLNAGPPVIGEDIEPTYLTSYIGNTNTFSITATGSAPIAYQWYQNGLPIVDATNQDYELAVLDCTNTYYCAVTNNYSAGVPTISSTATVIGIPSPTLSRADFNSQLKITVNGYDRPETLNNFPVLVELGTNIPGFSYSQFASAAGGDLRFTDSGGTNEIPYEINQWKPSGISSVWVQMPTLYGTNDVSATNNVIYAYWGNAADVVAPDYTTNGAVWLWSAPSYEVVYHLEQSGFPYLDSTLQYPATNGIAPVSTNGLIGQCLSFSHTPYLNAGFVNLGNAFTLSAWVNVPASAYSIQAVWDNGNGVADSSECQFYVDNYDTSDGTLTLTTGNGSTQDKLQSATGAVSFGQWHLVTAVVDRTDGNAQLYVDGNQVTNGLALTDFPTNADMDLGQDNGNSFQYTGLMDEARIRSGLSSTNWIWADWMTVAENSIFENYSTVSSPIVTLNIQYSGNSVILTWAEGTLQSASVVTGPYRDIPGATTPYTNTMSETQQFYRVYVGE